MGLTRSQTYFIIICFTIVTLLIMAFGSKNSKDSVEFKHVYVEWIDIVEQTGTWHSREEIEEWLLTEQDTVKQSGFLYRETLTHIILVDSYFDQDNLGGAIKIPKCNVVKIVEVK